MGCRRRRYSRWVHGRYRHAGPARPRALARAIIAGLMAAAVLACGPGSDGAVQVAAGTLDGQPWTARAGLAGASGLCLEIHVEGVAQDNRLCGLQGGESGLWRFDAGSGTFVAGTRADPTAASVRVTLADGSEVSAPLNGAGDATSLRFFVLVVPLGSPLVRLDTLDAAGEVLETIPLEDELPIKEPPVRGG